MINLVVTMSSVGWMVFIVCATISRPYPLGRREAGLAATVYAELRPVAPLFLLGYTAERVAEVGGQLQVVPARAAS